MCGLGRRPTSNVSASGERGRVAVGRAEQCGHLAARRDRHAAEHDVRRSPCARRAAAARRTGSSPRSPVADQGVVGAQPGELGPGARSSATTPLPNAFTDASCPALSSRIADATSSSAGQPLAAVLGRDQVADQVVARRAPAGVRRGRACSRRTPPPRRPPAPSTSAVRPYSYIATIAADHGRSRCRSSSGTPSSSAITATGSGSAKSAMQVERRQRRPASSSASASGLHPRPQPLDVPAGERLGDQRAQPGVRRRLVLHHLVAVQPVERLELLGRLLVPPQPAEPAVAQQPRWQRRRSARATARSARARPAGADSRSRASVGYGSATKAGSARSRVASARDVTASRRCCRRRPGGVIQRSGPALAPRQPGPLDLGVEQRRAPRPPSGAPRWRGPGPASCPGARWPGRAGAAAGPGVSRTLCIFSCSTTSRLPAQPAGPGRRAPGRRPRRRAGARRTGPATGPGAGTPVSGTASMSTPGSTRASSRRASARGATGQQHRGRAPGRSPTYPATLTSTRHHPCERHSHGSTIRTACTRPGGTVWLRVSSSPCRSRSPSGDSATVKPKCGPTRLHAAGTAARAIGTARPSTRPLAADAPRRRRRRPATTSAADDGAPTAGWPRSAGPAAPRAAPPRAPRACRAAGRRPGRAARPAAAARPPRTGRPAAPPTTPPPATSSRSSASPSARATSGRTTSTACSRSSRTRRDRRKSTPVSSRRSSSLDPVVGGPPGQDSRRPRRAGCSPRWR